MDICVEFDVVYVTDYRSSCITIASKMIHTAIFLSSIEKLMQAFSIYEKKGEIFFLTAVMISDRLFLNLITFSHVSNYGSLYDCIFKLQMSYLLFRFHTITLVSSNAILVNCPAVCFIVD